MALQGSIQLSRLEAVALFGGIRMQRVMVLTLGMAGLAACAPLNTYYKPGANVAAVQRQTTDCQVKALRDVPASTQIRRDPPRYFPPRQQCNNAGKCRTIPGYFAPGAVYTFDPNDKLRKRVELQCMADLGFAPVSIPACPDSVAKAAPVRATTTLPPLTENSCVIRNSNGSYQIVTRG